MAAEQSAFPGSDAAQLAELVEQEAALRRLAELAARCAAPQEVFDAIVVEASRLLGPSPMTLAQIGSDGIATIVALHGSVSGFAPGTRVSADRGGVLERVLVCGHPVRVDHARRAGARGRLAIRHGITGAVGAPIHVDGKLWGTLVASTCAEPLPATLETRLASFAELLGPAIAGATTRTELLALLDEQAALRRVAELVARGSTQEALFQAVADEASKLVDDEGTMLMRMSRDGTRGTVIATCGTAAVPVGTGLEIPPDDAGIVAAIVRNRAPARIDGYRDVDGVSYARDEWGISSVAGVPIVLDGHVWGLVAASRRDGPLPYGVEQRLGQFAELVAAALANAQARAQVEALADEQAALRRVAELVARAPRPEDIFAAVAREAAQLLGESTMLVRVDADGSLAVVAGSDPSSRPDALAVELLRAGREDRGDGSIAAPISIGGQLWGLLMVSSSERALPAGAEARVRQFADLVAVGIANAEARAALSASRARVMATADAVRHRVQRDVHDGAQQRLVQTVLALQMAGAALPDAAPAAAYVAEALEQAQKASAELGDIVRGILPAALTRQGLAAGVESLAIGLPLDIDLRVECGRLGAQLETTAYFVAAESLTNIVKHAHADRASVTIRAEGERLVVEIRDDGVGGVDPGRGTGITGLFDRVEAAGGTLAITSPPGGGTTVRAELPGTMSNDVVRDRAR